MKIGILYICTGRYSIFWKAFYESCDKHFIPESEKHYFVFTDANEIIHENENPKIHRLFQENLGWPNNTLKRFEIFLTIKDKLSDFDYLFFFNANLIFQKTITAQEFLPQGEESLVACLHPYYYNRPPNDFPYDRNEQSTAYIPFNKGQYYVQGALQGGTKNAFISAVETMAYNVNKDLLQNIIALWHDESQWNKYIAGRTDAKILSPAYLYPEGKKLPFPKKIEIVDKGRHFGFDYLRGKRDTPESDFKLFFKDTYRKIMFKIFKRNYYK